MESINKFSIITLACDPFAKRPRSEVNTNINDPPPNLENDFAGKLIMNKTLCINLIIIY